MTLKKKNKSKLGYRDDSPYRNEPYININTPNGIIDMSATGTPLMANGQYLAPYSGQHQMGTTKVKEVPIQYEENMKKKTTKKPSIYNNGGYYRKRNQFALGGSDIRTDYYAADRGFDPETNIPDTEIPEEGGANWGNVAKGVGVATQAVSGVMNTAQNPNAEVEDYVDVAQDVVGSVIPVAGLFHGLSETGQGVAAETGKNDKQSAQFADVSRRLFEPHTLITQDLFGTSEEEAYEKNQPKYGAFQTAQAKYGGNIYQNGETLETVPSYRNQTYGKGIMAKPYNELPVTQRRYLDYTQGVQGVQDADGNIIYSLITKNPGINYYGTSSVDYNKEENRQTGTTINGVNKVQAGGSKLSSFLDPWSGKAWEIPQQYLGKEYPKAVYTEDPVMMYGGNIFQGGGNLQTQQQQNDWAIQNGIKLGPNQKGVTQDPNTGAWNYTGSTDYGMPEATSITIGEGRPAPTTPYPFRKGTYINVWGQKIPVALRTPSKPTPVSPTPNTLQFGGQPGSVPTTEFNEGGTHEENPLGGIPQGMNPNGAPNLVEEGELKIKDPRNDEAFIISPKIKLDKTTAEEFDLEKKYIGKDMVKIFEKILRKDSKRDGDTIEEHSKQLEIAPYIDAHKVLSERKNAEEAAKEEAAFTLDMDNMMEKYPERMQSFTQPQQPQSPSPEEQMMIQQQQDASQEMPTQEQPIMTHGGNIYQGGAGMPQQQMPPQQEQGGGIEEQVAQTLQQGADPQEVIGQLVQSGMSEEQAMQLIQGIMQQLQRQSQEAPVPFVYGGNIYQTGNYAPVDYNYWKQQSEPQVTIPERMVEDANPITVSRDPNLILEDPSKENVTSTTKTNVVEDEEYGPKTFEFESPIQSYLKYAPVAYNLAQGLFGKEDKRKVSDYYNPVSAPIQDISHQIAAMERQHAGYAKGIKQGSGQGGYKSNMLAANLALQDRIGQAFEGKGNKDAQAKMQADLFNAAAKTQAAITKDQFNAMSKAQKQAYLDTALTQLGQIGDTAERNELGLTYANMMSPDYQLTKKDLFDLTKDEK